MDIKEIIAVLQRSLTGNVVGYRNSRTIKMGTAIRRAIKELKKSLPKKTRKILPRCPGCGMANYPDGCPDCGFGIDGRICRTRNNFYDS